MLHLWKDVVYTVRSLARTPAMALTIVLTVGCALGATTGMMSVVRAVLVSPLPYASPASLYWVYTDTPPFHFRFSVVDYRALEADHPAFSAVAAYQTSTVTVTDGGTAERVTAKSVTGSYFPLVGQTPHFGRLFDESDDARDNRGVVLTYSYWTQRFARDPNVVGRAISIDGVSYTIGGVLQKDVGPLEHNVAMFTVAHWPAAKRKGPFFTMVLGRLRPDVSRAAALESLRATNRRLFPLWKSSYQDEKATWGIQDLKVRVVGDSGSTILFALAAVGCVLLIACANAVTLLIARGLGRGRELAIRSALGATRGRLVQHLLVEAGVLTGGAAIVGVAVAALAIQLVTTYGDNYIPRISEVRFSGSVLAWLAGLAGVSGLVIGLVPALQSARLRMSQSLGSGGRSATAGPSARRLWRALVATEFALATPLIVAAVLVTVSLNRLSHVQVGIDTSRILTGSVDLSGPRYAREEDRKAFWERAVERIGALPGVQAAAVSDSRPPDEAGDTNNFDLEDHPTPSGQNQPLSTWVGVSPAFFKTVGLPLRGGRLLDERSVDENVIVVDRAWADRFFPHQEVIGRRLTSGGCTTCPWTTVVGLVDTVKWQGLDAPDTGTVYFPLVDLPNAYFVLRTSGDPGALTTEFRQVVRDLDPGLPLSNVATGDDLVAESLTTPRYLSVLVGIFAIAALVLSVVGIYGVMAYFVNQHTRDIGIRLALGGEPSAMRRMVVGQGLRLVIAGVIVGAAVALVGSRLIRTLLFGISPSDPRTIAAVPLTLLAIAALACLVPARRAARLDPAEILRE
jgi:putative ABC transport system permease protein